MTPVEAAQVHTTAWTPTMAAITRALADLHATEDTPLTRWEVYPAADTADGEAHLYADLIVARSEIPEALRAWARILGTELSTVLDGNRAVLTITACLPGGVRVTFREEASTEGLPDDLRTAPTADPALF
ncbi:hypothetical protein BJF83_17425 [Nocardiopsis sp. CNR-923]|uniref:hypothetical protein n=1 Tax=Nocardiopsis sp. CNR-923 TaxID=1904965 RepID=UPI00095E3001|nr:hypothetical protein [Nocardiopsis sp. CNR-923]OLT27764.1 hypothetical protein BJF83_17425 [Nocardiopsis sp. CNR-923]